MQEIANKVNALINLILNIAIFKLKMKHAIAL